MKTTKHGIIMAAIMAAFTLFAGSAMAITAPATTGGLYAALVTNLLNGEIGYVVAIGLVALGVFMAFRSMAMMAISFAAAIIFWNAEGILQGVLGMVI